MTSNGTIDQDESSIDQLRKTVKEGYDATMSRFNTGQGCLDKLRETQAAILDRLDDIKDTQVAQLDELKASLQKLAQAASRVEGLTESCPNPHKLTERIADIPSFGWLGSKSDFFRTTMSRLTASSPGSYTGLYKPDLQDEVDARAASGALLLKQMAAVCKRWTLRIDDLL
ncbi:hypothetical protein OC834_007201 [Tilletia horrida]|nr:hypothetical protein OC834_007201 [Tilletia horrida]